MEVEKLDIKTSSGGRTQGYSSVVVGGGRN